MLIPIKWLKEYVSFDLTPAELAEKLVSCGFEIEQIIDLAANVKNVVSARVVALAKHPSADRLKVATLDTGKAQGVLQVVTNSTTVKEGDIVPVALDGAMLATGVRIKKGELRGVASAGMLCGMEELGITEYPGADKEGVLVFLPDTPVGEDVNKLLGKDEIVLDVGITANRIDANSIYGIAREVAAATGAPLKPLNFDYKENKEDIASYVALSNLAPDLCPRYMAKVVKNVRLCPSPELIQNRLRAVGLRPINNIVDITNYVLYEIGQPMHAFDLKMIADSKITVRRAEEEEKIVCLDDKTYTLGRDNLVIANGKEPMAIAGIMGGKNYSILPDTTAVVFESARFARDNVRKTSRSLNLRSDSSARFEKGVDFWSQDAGLRRALALISEYGWGEIVGGTLDSFPVRPETKRIVFSVKDIERILGINVPEQNILGILKSLTFKVNKEKEMLVAEIPPYREDMAGINDIAEEVIRIYGYSHIRPELMEGKTAAGGKTKRQEFADKIKNILLAKGMSEIVTYSFVSPRIFDLLRLPSEDPLREAVKINNPLGEDFSIMRTTLAHSMIKTLATNFQRGNKAVRLFEVAKTYLPKALPLTELPIEKNTLCLGALNDDFYGFKSILEDLLAVLHIDADFIRGSKPYLHPGRSAIIVAPEGSVIGYMGEVDDLVAANYDVDKRLYIAELDEEYLLDHARSGLPFKVNSRYPAVERDIAVLCDKRTEAAELLKTVRASGGELLIDSYVFDVYTGDQVEEGKKSVAIKLICQSKERTLKDEDVNAVVSGILDALSTIGARLR
jgi:phenylalanyl-tRNA synthetase beta chain